MSTPLRDADATAAEDYLLSALDTVRSFFFAAPELRHEKLEDLSCALNGAGRAMGLRGEVPVDAIREVGRLREENLRIADALGRVYEPDTGNRVAADVETLIARIEELVAREREHASCVRIAGSIAASEEAKEARGENDPGGGPSHHRWRAEGARHVEAALRSARRAGVVAAEPEPVTSAELADFIAAAAAIVERAELAIARKPRQRGDQEFCDFCGRDRSEVSGLSVAPSTAAICDDCIGEAQGVLLGMPGKLIKVTRAGEGFLVEAVDREDSKGAARQQHASPTPTEGTAAAEPQSTDGRARDAMPSGGPAQVAAKRGEAGDAEAAASPASAQSFPYVLQRLAERGVEIDRLTAERDELRADNERLTTHVKRLADAAAARVAEEGRTQVGDAVAVERRECARVARGWADKVRATADIMKGLKEPTAAERAQAVAYTADLIADEIAARGGA